MLPSQPAAKSQYDSDQTFESWDSDGEGSWQSKSESDIVGDDSAISMLANTSTFTTSRQISAARK
eukprot:181331-Karenia_brevis.AAC.1